MPAYRTYDLEGPKKDLLIDLRERLLQGEVLSIEARRTALMLIRKQRADAYFKKEEKKTVKKVKELVKSKKDEILDELFKDLLGE